jgi:ribosomal protein S18 acetylase RimI-like enzyme
MRVSVVTRPNQGIRQMFRISVMSYGLLSIVGMISFGIGYGILVGPIAGIANGVLGLIGGVLCIAFGALSVMKHICLRAALRLQGRVPRNLVAFLEFVSSIVVMRQVGGRYLFEHNTLREYFLEQYYAQTQKGPGATPHVDVPIQIALAGPGDVQGVSRIFYKHFGYVYAALLNTDPRQTQRIIEHLVGVCDGRSWIGYRTFWVAREQETGEIIGIMQCSPISLAARPRIAAAVMRTLSQLPMLIEGFNYFAALMRLPATLSAVSRPRSNREITITYIAVEPHYQRQRVGGQLLSFVDTIARENRRSTITAHVRTGNTAALHFFIESGFQLSHEQHSKSDGLFARGARYCLEREIGERL